VIQGVPGQTVEVRQPDRIGSYNIERLLGTGSFASVWLGHDPALDARVAIKVLADNWSLDAAVTEHFVDEARVLWKLDHERVVRVHAFGRLDDGRPYSVMSWADGGSLKDALAAGPLPSDVARTVLIEVARAVGALHDHGYIHRDLTPGNVLFKNKPDGTRAVLVGDLGLAKALATASGLTMQAGTPGYMAPEQSLPMGIVSVQTDVYALGVLGSELLGARANANDLAVFAIATADNPKDRYASAGLFVDAFDTAGRSLAPALAPRSRHARRTLGRGPVLATLVLVATVAVVAVTALRSSRSNRFNDDQGRLSVVLPDGWNASGGGWVGRVDANNVPWPAIAMSSNLDKWSTDPAVPGAFVAIAKDATATVESTRNAVAHNECSRRESSAVALANGQWLMTVWSQCPGGVSFTEAAATIDDTVVYAQVKTVAAQRDGEISELLSSVVVSSPQR
jgi:eukaryotic-like serine/threonine-protein kinase